MCAPGYSNFFGICYHLSHHWETPSLLLIWLVSLIMVFVCLQVGHAFGWVEVGTVAIGLFGFALITSGVNIYIYALFSFKPNKHPLPPPYTFFLHYSCFLALFFFLSHLISVILINGVFCVAPRYPLSNIFECGLFEVLV